MTMTPRSARRDLVVSGVVVVASAITVLTCSAIGRTPHQPSKNASAGSASSHVPAPVASNPALPTTAGSVPLPLPPMRSWVAPRDLGSSPEGNAIPRLPRFYEALARLSIGLRHDHVRIVWLGDSHTQADVWTHAVRDVLQRGFGNGGPGFVHVGWDTYGYRHEDVSLDVHGRWSIRPLTLVSVKRVDDGVFGLGGLRLIPRGMNSRASVIVSSRGLPGAGRWDLALRFTEAEAGIAASIDGTPRQIEANPRTFGSIRHVDFRSRGPGGKMTLDQPSGKPQVLGVVIESADRHGVVLDTLGLNGARVRSALAWDEETWVAELARREPDLVVLAFGTNESSNPKLKEERHTRRVRKLVGRIRRAAPESDCLLFGPIDRGGERYENVDRKSVV